jgi:hypothetical protein
MTAPIVFQCDWLGPIVVIVDETEMAQDEATPQRERWQRRPNILTRFWSAVRRSADG